MKLWIITAATHTCIQIVISHRVICHQTVFQLRQSSQYIIYSHLQYVKCFLLISKRLPLPLLLVLDIPKGRDWAEPIKSFLDGSFCKMPHTKSIFVSTQMPVYVCPRWAWLTELPSSPVGKKKLLISCIYDLTRCELLLIPTEVIHSPREEEDLVSNTYTYTTDTCMHSNTTSFVVNAFPPPHTIKVPIKGHYGFSTSSNHRESSSTARTLRPHRCLLCCHPKELRLIRKLYDHNYWSKLKCHNNINSEDAINFFFFWVIPVRGAKWDNQR